MDVILFLVFVFSLVCLAMIFGDRLSLFGAGDDRWLLSPLDLVSRFWQMLCEIIDRAVCFVFDHFWWVAATTSGGVGVLLIALLMFSGLSQEAEAVRRDKRMVMNAGGVLDYTPKLISDQVLLAGSGARELISPHLVQQEPSRDRFVVPEFREQLAGERLPIRQAPTDLAISRPVIAPEANRKLSRLRLTLNPFVEFVGQRIEDPAISEMINDTLADLRRDDWLAFSEIGYRNRRQVPRAELPETSRRDVDRMLQSVRIVASESVAAQDLDVEKSMPRNPSSGEFDIEIRIRNVGVDTLSGIVVREQLPLSWLGNQMRPAGAYRENTAIWVLDNLSPDEDRILRLSVTAEAGEFQTTESMTEVSCVSAVRSPVIVDRERGREPEFTRPQYPEFEPRPRGRFDFDEPEPPRREVPIREPRRQEFRPLELPPVTDDVIPESPRFRPRETAPIRIPDVRLTLLQRPEQIEVGDVLTVYFEVQNVGDAEAEGVSLRVNLPREVDHKKLSDNDFPRRVESRVNVLKPSERRQMKLHIRPNTAGRHLVTAMLMLGTRELDVQEFDVRAAGALREDAGDFPPIDETVPAPAPDRNVR